MALQDIIQRIAREASAEADGIVQQARARCDELRQSARSEAEKRKEQILKAAREQAEDVKKRVLTMAELDNRKALLSAKQTMVDKAFEHAIQSLGNMDPHRYSKVMKKLLLSAVETGDEEVIVSAADKKRLGDGFLEAVNKELVAKGLAGKLSFANETRNMSGGFILRRGNVELNATFDTRIKQLRDIIEADVAGILFQDGPTQELRK
ncbi:MAG TPA: hypothetical protein GXX40_04205 [Firmicutes bacterium]|nr:hypothetical protein [Bacillota bacterium]